MFVIETPTGTVMRTQFGIAEFQSQESASEYLASLGVNEENAARYTIKEKE